MNRKQFVGQLKDLTLSTAASAFALRRSVGENRTNAARSTQLPLSMSELQRIRNEYESDLFSRFLPAMSRFVVDHDHGGFMCNVDIRTGRAVSHEKRAWYEGRGIWLYATLYQRFGRQDDHLRIAADSRRFILEHRPDRAGEYWPGRYDREGGVIDREGDIFANLYIAEGLTAYASATSDEEALQEAIGITRDAFLRYDSPDYRYGSSAASGLNGPRVLNHWMVFLFTAVQILEQTDSADIRRIVNRSVDAVLEHHLNPRYRLLNDTLTHGLSLPEEKDRQIASVGLGIQTLWMVMAEAVRNRDKALFQTASGLFRRHVEVARDRVYGGHFATLIDVEGNRWSLNKALGVQEEVMIGLLMMIEYLGDTWAADCFRETESYIKRHFAPDGYYFWISGGDRRLKSFQTERVEHYHHSRHLMFTLSAVERMIERKGVVSDHFGSV